MNRYAYASPYLMLRCLAKCMPKPKCTPYQRGLQPARKAEVQNSSVFHCLASLCLFPPDSSWPNTSYRYLLLFPPLPLSIAAENVLVEMIRSARESRPRFKSNTQTLQKCAGITRDFRFLAFTCHCPFTVPGLDMPVRLSVYRSGNDARMLEGLAEPIPYLHVPTRCRRTGLSQKRLDRIQLRPRFSAEKI